MQERKRENGTKPPVSLFEKLRRDGVGVTESESVFTRNFNENLPSGVKPEEVELSREIHVTEMVNAYRRHLEQKR